MADGASGVRRPVVLVTGASQGIGAAIARAYADRVGGTLILVARTRNKLETVADECRARGVDTAVFEADLSDESSVGAMAEAVSSRFGAPDVLINNAGKFIGKPFLETTSEEFEGILNANLFSLFRVAKAFVPQMVQRGSGHIFNMSSIAGLDAYPGGSAYCAAKFGVTGLSKVLRQELKSSGIRVTTVYPGATFTPSWDGSGVSAERMMSAETVAQAFVDAYLLGPDSVVEDIVLRPQLGDI